MAICKNEVRPVNKHKCSFKCLFTPLFTLSFVSSSLIIFMDVGQILTGCLWHAAFGLLFTTPHFGLGCYRGSVLHFVRHSCHSLKSKGSGCCPHETGTFLFTAVSAPRFDTNTPSNDTCYTNVTWTVSNPASRRIFNLFLRRFSFSSRFFSSFSAFSIC